jgi:hypothetical protein
MSFLIDIILMITLELCSWRVALCLLMAIALVFGLLIVYPENDGFLPFTAYAGIVLIGIGGVWQYVSERG